MRGESMDEPENWFGKTFSEEGTSLITSTNSQRDLYERILPDYNAHFFDKWSMRYRDEFVFDPMWHDLDLNGKHVADLACGSGYNSVALRKRFPSARVTGLDISPSACAEYERN